MEITTLLELQAVLHVEKGRLVDFLAENDVKDLTSEYPECKTIDWMLDCILGARFEEIFNNEEIRAIVKGTSKGKVLSSLKESIHQFVHSSSDLLDRQYHQLIVQFIGVAALQFFVRLNWFGPIHKRVSSILSFSSEIEDFDECISILCLCNLSVYSQIQCPELLVLAKVILHDSDLQTVTKAWWEMRYLSVHQAVLQDKNSQIYSMVTNAINKATSTPVSIIKDFENQLKTEAALLCIRFHDITKAKEYLKSVQEDSGIGLKLSGALGKRTQFQTISYSQMYLKIQIEKEPNASLYRCNTDIPVDVKLQDETLLNKIQFQESEVNDSIQLLRPEEQSVILAVSALHQKQTAHDSLQEEELTAYANAILSHPQIFCIQFCALLLRSKLEKQSAKKVERSMMQLQALLDEFNKSTECSHNRFHLFYSTPMPPIWVVEKELANVLLSLGSIKSALDIFLRLHMWEECVFCYRSLQRNDKALEIIEAELEKGKTPLLLCLKGDVTDEPSCYEEAWELSDHHSARAKRSLGYYYFQKKEYKQCIPHLLQSVEIDSLEQRAWFFLGHAATQIENYELAARCYRHLVNLDYDSFEAWNNLSNAYIRMNDKLRAWRTLQEAIKCNYEEWKVWENYLLVSVDVGAFEEAINAWHRLIDIKGKHVDEEVLSILVKAVVENLNDINNQPASNLLEKMLKLLGHITATDTTSSKTWSCYAALLEYKASVTGELILLDRVILYHQKSWNIIKNEMQKNLTQTSLIHCKALLDSSCKLVDVYLKRYTSSSNEGQAKQQLHSARLMIRNTTALLKKASEHFVEKDLDDIITPGVDELESKMETILNELKD